LKTGKSQRLQNGWRQISLGEKTGKKAESSKKINTVSFKASEKKVTGPQKIHPKGKWGSEAEKKRTTKTRKRG